MRTTIRVRYAFVAIVSLAAIAWVGSSLAAKPGSMRETEGGQAADDQRGVEPVPAVVHVAMPVTAQAAKTWIKLQGSIPMQFPDETPLEDVLKYIKAATESENDTGIPIYVDPRGLQEAEKTLQSPVVLDLQGVPLTTSLDLLLKQLDLSYYVQKDGILMIVAESDESNALSNPTAAMLDHLTKLRSEVAALRSELTALHLGGNPGGPNERGMMMRGGTGAGMR